MKADTGKQRCRNAGVQRTPDGSRKDQKGQIAPVLISQLSFRICRQTSYLVCNKPGGLCSSNMWAHHHHFQTYLILCDANLL